MEGGNPKDDKDYKYNVMDYADSEFEEFG